ncbi:hypothetical protein CspeluHIS016_0209970 [Cutaneotrichosporon spelunceum]|uniref:Uncharacterized protein n=1 Tax=Cutaneotrichosporon spelunceum TaxID=1672016 RepID=A0AAD3YAG5_9TREE|nr:hypothetical protein CspeluHIS016_0209970 [Cutaneotrichosporon spelunceum]
MSFQDVAPVDDRSSVSSVTSSRPSSGQSCITVASTGLEFFEYRRACFLAGAPLPTVSPSSSAAPPKTTNYNPPPTYNLPVPPPPAPSVPYDPSPTSVVGRLEALLAEFSEPADELHDPAAVAWHGGIGNVHRNLTGSKRLAKGLRLGFVIRILRAGWVKDGTWPCEDGLPVDPPSSPELGPVREIKYPPPHENRRPRKVNEDTIRGPRRPTVHDAVSPSLGLSPAKEKSTFGSRLAALTSSFLSGGSAERSSSSSAWSIGPSSAVMEGTDSPMLASPLMSEGPAARQVAPMPMRRRLERI